MDSKQSPYSPPNAYPPPGFPQQGYHPYEQPHPQQGYPPQQRGEYPPNQPSYTPVPQMQPQQGGSEKHPSQPLALPATTIQPGKFQNPFCSCFDNMGLCCLGCWCPCIVFGKTRARFNNPRLSKEQLPCCSGACCGFATVAMFCPPFQCIFGWMQRGDIRSKYDIEGNGCVDCLAHSFCDCCALIQENREVEAREDAAMLGGATEPYYA